MILSNTRLHEALDRGWIVIDPPPEPRLPGEGIHCPYQTSAVDLRLGNEIAYLSDGLPVNVDLRLGSFVDLFGPNSRSVTITEEQPFALASHRLVLGRSLERIELPICDGSPCYAARVEGRSSFARCGLLVHLTAPTVHAGFAGSITLELINVGPVPILLYPRMPICQLVFEQVDGVPFRNDGQFQSQSRPGGKH